MLKTYDSTLRAYIEHSPKNYDAQTKAWVDSPSAKIYDAVQRAWVEIAHRFITLYESYVSASSVSKYTILDNGNSVNVSLQNNCRDDYFSFAVDNLSIPFGSTIKFDYELVGGYTTELVCSVYDDDGIQRIYQRIHSTSSYEFVVDKSNGYANQGKYIKRVVFSFATYSESEMAYVINRSSLKNVKIGNVKLRFA